MRIIKRITRSALLIAATSFCSLVAANGEVSGEIKAFIVNQDLSGKEQVVESTHTAPGETMEFRIVFTNNGEESVNGVRVVDPIPDNTLFLQDSHLADVPAVFEVSIDGGESFELEPVTRIETQPDGTQKEVIVPPEQYTHVRWLANEALASNGGSQAFSYRVVVK